MIKGGDNYSRINSNLKSIVKKRDTIKRMEVY